MDPAAAAAAAAADADARHLPLLNLSKLRSRMDTVHRFLSDSINRNTIIPDAQMNIVSTEIAAAINDLIVNGAALISSNFTSPSPNSTTTQIDLGFPKPEALEHEHEHEIEGGFDNIVEIDAVELLAEHLHFCDFCGKGFKRDANLRMHMRAHGSKFKTLEALSKPEKLVTDLESTEVKGTKFSCPFNGCNRNKVHKKFRPLKSVICVKNHFKRSHCPKMYSCNKCNNKKSFSVLADLKSHLKHCGETKWKCSCGTSFSRKDKLFGHMALFEGHMPAVNEDNGKGKGVVQEQVPPPVVAAANVDWVDNDMFFDGLGSIDDDFDLQGMLGDGCFGWDL